MRKKSISTPSVEKSQNYFKYEMKETNQLLKDLLSCGMSETYSRSDENKSQNLHQFKIKETNQKKDPFLIKWETQDLKYEYKDYRQNQLVEETRRDTIKYEDQLFNQQNSIFKSYFQESALNNKRKPSNCAMDDLILNNFYQAFSESDPQEDGFHESLRKYRLKELESLGNQKAEDSKDLKKQKKGLANISLRVKNIIAQHKKLTYKQVSDLVLQSSKDEIDQLESSQRLREVKNIKRRVYDALNVLVAVGILGKQQRCVCMTEWTDIPGKKHSSQWQKINSKVEQLTTLKKNCTDKQETLKLLMEKYNAIAALRNKHLQEERTVQKVFNTHQNSRKKQILKCEQSESEETVVPHDKRLEFPVIVFCPTLEDEDNDKLTVQLEHQGDGNPNIEKIKISGKNITILGDFDCALELNLEKFRDRSAENKLIEEMNQYSKKYVNKKMPEQKQQAPPNIEDYFTQQVFESM